MELALVVAARNAVTPVTSTSMKKMLARRRRISSRWLTLCRCAWRCWPLRDRACVACMR